MAIVQFAPPNRNTNAHAEHPYSPHSSSIAGLLGHLAGAHCSVLQRRAGPGATFNHLHQLRYVRGTYRDNPSHCRMLGRWRSRWIPNEQWWWRGRWWRCLCPQCAYGFTRVVHCDRWARKRHDRITGGGYLVREQFVHTGQGREQPGQQRHWWRRWRLSEQQHRNDQILRW